MRIPILLDTPATVRWLSCEPLLGPVYIANYAWLYNGRGIDWVVVGGESGSNARPMHPDWARSLRDQCADADAPYLFKQWGEWAPDESTVMRRVGKKRAGRLLDGVQHDSYPRGSTL